ncbi:MAG: glycosyltransferase family A protein [Bacillota bacterium]|nr:glycosyltransferase family A protein [Bacillota bacterium]
MFYSIIVPCYNCDETIAPLLDSVINQEVDLNDIEIILVDDTIDHSFRSVVEPQYTNALNIKFVGTDLRKHNPGNSRNYGIDAATGDWLVFIDCDDTLRPNALSEFSKTIKEHPEAKCIFGKVKQFHPDGTEYTDAEDYQSVSVIWMHGKCYKREFIEKYKIRFKDSMFTCEDYYFNYQVQAYLLSEDSAFTFIDTFVYNWLYNPKSLSHSVPYVYEMKMHFNDYLEASILPWTKPTEGNLQPVFEQYIYYLLIGYFLYQYYISKGIYFDKWVFRQSLAEAYERFGLTVFDFINQIEHNVDSYYGLYKVVIEGFCNEPFVPPYSPRTFFSELFK